jgi:hypothetical protein
MSTGQTGPGGGQPSEEELRAAYEAEIKRLRVEQVLLENVVSLVNLGMRRTGLAPGTEDERDPAQVQLAIESVRAVIPLVDQAAPAQAKAIKDALSQLQMAYVRIGGQPADTGAAPDPGGEGPGGSGEPGGPAGPGGPGGGPGPKGPGGAPGGGPGGAPEGGAPGSDPGSGPAQRSGRLWVPGQ